MKKTIALSIIAASVMTFCGCSSTGAIIRALAKDPASWQITVTTPWGSAEYVRTGWRPVTNNMGQVVMVPTYAEAPTQK